MQNVIKRTLFGKIREQHPVRYEEANLSEYRLEGRALPTLSVRSGR